MCFATLQRSFVLGNTVPFVQQLQALLLLLSVSCCVLASPTAEPKQPPAQRAAASKPSAPRADVRSAAYVVVDERSSEVLLEKDADTAVPIASITKLMAALVVLEAGQPLDEVLKITQDDRMIDPGGRSRLAVGASLTRGELLRLSLMSSENRAANAVGRNYPGGLPSLLQAMNAKAKALGMKSARFVDATGLSSGNVSSPRDLVKLVNAAARHPLIREYSTDPEETVIVGKQVLEYRNTNQLVGKPDWDILVQKTGFTNAAGQCLVMKAIIDDRPIVMVLMNSFGKLTRVADARRVRKWMASTQESQHYAQGQSGARARHASP